MSRRLSGSGLGRSAARGGGAIAPPATVAPANVLLLNGQPVLLNGAPIVMG